MVAAAYCLKLTLNHHQVSRAVPPKSTANQEEQRAALVFHQFVDVMLGPVLRCGHFEHVGYAQERLQGLLICDNL